MLVRTDSRRQAPAAMALALASARLHPPLSFFFFSRCSLLTLVVFCCRRGRQGQRGVERAAAEGVVGSRVRFKRRDATEAHPLALSGCEPITASRASIPVHHLLMPFSSSCALGLPAHANTIHPFIHPYSSTRRCPCRAAVTAAAPLCSPLPLHHPRPALHRRPTC